MKRISLVFCSLFFAFLAMGSSPTAATRTKETNCTFTREYVTTLEYLRKKKEYGIPEQEAQKLAHSVSRGCTGSAQRFIKVISALGASGVSANDAVRSALEFSNRSDTETETFVSIFLKSFLEEFLDLDLMTSLKIARSLSTEFQGDVLAVRDDFERLVSFCSKTKNLNLGKPECASFAARIAHKGEKVSGGIADPFVRLYDFLISEKGPALTVEQALKLAESLTEGGRDSADNFIQAFKYGISKKGLDLSGQDALQFAQKMTVPE